VVRQKVNACRIPGKMARTGRRPGPNASRATILDVARQRFAGRGYDATSIRAIAAEAGVDPGVVMHFFDSKAGLFQAAVGWPFDPAGFVAQLAEPSSESLATRLARAFLTVWDEPATRAPLLAVFRSAMTQAASAALLREFIVSQVFSRIAGFVDGPQAALRANLAASHLIGLVVLRHVLRVEPVASADIDTVVALLGPPLSLYLESAAGRSQE
jgi:AcrR family transcriptional regulator